MSAITGRLATGLRLGGSAGNFTPGTSRNVILALTILAIGLLVFFGHVLGALFQRAKVPDVLLLMAAGILLGPVLHVVTPEDFGKVGAVFTTLALVVILFEGGIHLNLRQLIAAAADTLTIALATSVITLLLVALLAEQLLALDFISALLVGAILSGTSSAVVVPMVRTLGLRGRAGTVLFLESALTDVTAIVLTLGLLQALVAGADGGTGALSPRDLLGRVVASFLLAALIGAAGAFVWSAVLERIRRFPNTVFTTLAYVFIVYGVTELAGYSGAIAALTFGIALANLPLIPDRMLGKVFRFRLSPFADHERAFFAEVVFLVKTFFFVYLGVSVTFADVRAVVGGFVLAGASFVARAPVVRLLGRPELSRRDAALMWALVPKGLAAAVLAALPGQLGLAAGPAIQGVVYSTIFFSILGSALLVFGIERGLLAGVLARLFGKFPLDAPAAPPAPPPDAIPVAAVATLSSADIGLLEPNPLPDTDRASS